MEVKVSDFVFFFVTVSSLTSASPRDTDRHRPQIGLDKSHAPPFGQFLYDMPLMVTQNVANTPLVNGMLVFGVAVIMDDKEPPDPDSTSRERTLQFVPRGVIVSTSRHIDVLLSVSELLQRPDVFYVPQTCTRFTKGGGKGTRTQVPLSPALALTIHKAQGLTLPCAILDFCSPPVGGKLLHDMLH